MILLIQITIFDEVLRHEFAITGGFREWDAAIARANLAIGKVDVACVEPCLLRDRLAQLHARGIDARRRVVAAPLPA
jgi:hypothetical protein